jgi:hypothetical protein
MMDLDREQHRKTYQVCRTAFLLLAISLIPPCIEGILYMVALLGDPGLRRWLENSPMNQWISTLCVWGSFAGAMLLWGRWNHASWQRRTAFLLFMCVVDLVLWFLERGEPQGPGIGNWFRINLGQALGWAEFALLASLTGDYLVHLGLEQADESARSTRSLAATGAVVWMLSFCELTNWDRGWPLQPRNAGFHGWILYLAWHLIWTITLIQVTALVIAALRHTSRTLLDLHREETEQEVLAWPSQSPRDDLLALADPSAMGRE